jgi:3-hydroxyisobutyrate dehydrogenase-like beta-hydroxyacid dehydrogenase
MAETSTESRVADASPQIGIVGLGRMGVPIAANLAAAGREVIAYVRHDEQVGRLAALGIKPTSRITDLFACGVVITMLPDDDAVRDVVFGRKNNGGDALLSGLPAGAIHLSMSTISTAAASQLASDHARHGQGYVAAPVFGNPDAAQARELFIITAGAPTDVERCMPIFEVLGRQTFVVGKAAPTANLIKLLGNAMSAASLEIISELFALARKRGLDPERLLAILTGTMFGSRFHRIYGGKVASEQYRQGGFVFPLALKDVRLALQEAEMIGVPMPSISVVHDRLVAGIARGYGDFDWSALGLLAADEAGLAARPRKARD